MPASLFCAFSTAYLTVHSAGLSVYAFVALVSSVALLVPINDFGYGIVLLRETSLSASQGQRPSREIVQFALIRTAEIAALAIGVSLLLLVSGGWHILLKTEVAHSELLAACGMVLWALTIPASLGARMLQGLNRNDLVVYSTALGGVTTLGIAAVDAATGGAAAPFVLAPFAGQLASNTICWAVGVRLIRELSSPDMSVNQGGEERHGAYHAALVTNALPLGYQSDRLILDHIASTSALANYSLTAQVYQAAQSLVVSAGIALWPELLRPRGTAAELASDIRHSISRFALLGLGVGLACGSAGPLVARLLGGTSWSQLEATSWAFAALITLQSVHQPLIAALGSFEGMRFHSIQACVFLPFNLGLSILLARTIGVAGPVLASVASAGLVLVAPQAFICLRPVYHKRFDVGAARASQERSNSVPNQARI